MKKQATPNQHSLRGFTLTEILVAIALLLIIMVSVATIFRNASQAVTVGMAVTSQNRAMADAAQQLQQDLVGHLDANPLMSTAGMVATNAATDGPPFMYILNYQQASYRNQADETAGTTTNYRLDSLGFFANGAYLRQTGSNGRLVDEMPVINRAFIWYGHLWMPDNTGINWPATSLPGAGTHTNNPYNYYANQWVLGRRALLMADVGPIGSTTVGTIRGYSGPLTFCGRQWYPLAQGQNFGASTQGQQWDPQNFAPFGKDSSNYAPVPPCPSSALSDDQTLAVPSWQTYQSRCDLVGMNREQGWGVFADLVQNYQDQWSKAVQPPGFTLPWPLRYFSTRSWGSLVQNLDIDWTSANNADVANHQRVFGDVAALAVPALLRSCTSFTVEFAGDYVSQKDDGSLTVAHPVFDVNNPSTWMMDGVIDFNVINGVRQIHWYGRPVDVNGDGAITLPVPAGSSGDVTTVSQMRSGNPSINTPQVPFETWDASGNAFFGWTKNMLALPDTSNPPVKQSLAPQLIRITVQVSDPQGRVVDDMTRQYIFPVKHDW